MCRPYHQAIRPLLGAKPLIVAAAVLLGLGMGRYASAKPGHAVSPSHFGRIYRANRSALVRVRAEKVGAKWTDGVVIGAQGEILFGINPSTTPKIRVRLASGLERSATVLGFDRRLSVAVARLDGPDAPRLAPPTVDLKARLTPERWLVVMTHDKRGESTSYAGQVVGPGGKRRFKVDVPGQVGSPLLSLEGGLVGISVTSGKRRVLVRSMADLMPFLSRVVIGPAH